jgi:large-conductance mechanosensitive channel
MVEAARKATGAGPYEYTPTEVAVNLKKVVTWLIVAFVVFYVIQQPEKSADMVRSAGHALGAAASSMSAFVGSLV